MESIAETVPSAGFVAFGPEQGEKSLPGTSEVSAHGEHGQSRLGPAFRQGRHRSAGRPLHCEPSQHPESEHLISAVFLVLKAEPILRH